MLLISRWLTLLMGKFTDLDSSIEQWLERVTDAVQLELGALNRSSCFDPLSVNYYALSVLLPSDSFGKDKAAIAPIDKKSLIYSASVWLSTSSNSSTSSSSASGALLSVPSGTSSTVALACSQSKIFSVSISS